MTERRVQVGIESKNPNDEKKEFLISYIAAKKDVIRYEEQLREIRSNKVSPSIINDGMPHAVAISDLSGYAAQVDEVERIIISARYKRIQAFKRVQESIEILSDTNEKNLLTYRYLRGMKWEEICVAMGYSWRKIHYLHSDALDHFEICA